MLTSSSSKVFHEIAILKTPEIESVSPQIIINDQVPITITIVGKTDLSIFTSCLFKHKQLVESTANHLNATAIQCRLPPLPRELK